MQVRFISLMVCFAIVLISIGCVTTSGRPSPAMIGQAVKAAGITNPEVLKKLDIYFYKMKKEKAFAIDPFDKSWHHWSRSYRRTADAKKYATVFGEVLFAVNNTIVWNEELAKYFKTALGKGRKAFHEARYDDAIKYFDQSIHEHGPSWYIYNKLGWTHHNSGNQQIAIAQFKESLQYKSNDFSRIGIASSYLLLGNPSAAQNSLKKVSSNMTNKERDTYNYVQAMIFASLGEYRQAVEVLDDTPILGLRYTLHNKGIKVLVTYPGSPIALAGLKGGDIIIKYNDTELAGRELGFIQSLTQKQGLGSVGSIVFVRNGKAYKSQIVNGFTSTLADDAAQLNTLIPVTE